MRGCVRNMIMAAIGEPEKNAISATHWQCQNYVIFILELQQGRYYYHFLFTNPSGQTCALPFHTLARVQHQSTSGRNLCTIVYRWFQIGKEIHYGNPDWGLFLQCRCISRIKRRLNVIVPKCPSNLRSIKFSIESFTARDRSIFLQCVFEAESLRLPLSIKV